MDWFFDTGYVYVAVVVVIIIVFYLANKEPSFNPEPIKKRP